LPSTILQTVSLPRARANETAQKVEEYGNLREYLKAVDIWSLKVPTDIVKYAHHGFWGNVHQLLELYRDQSRKYICNHMTRIRESLRQDKNPRVNEIQIRGLNVNWKDEVGFCGMKKDARAQELCTNQCYTCPYLG
jgi:hypothetical protein